MMCSSRVHPRPLVITVSLAAMALLGCASSDPTGGSGGAARTGGVTSSGGATGSGGASGSGGVTGSGGAIGSGGVTGSGGLGPSGGTSGTGGAKGTGGASGSGGVVGNGGVLGTGGILGTGGASTITSARGGTTSVGGTTSNPTGTGGSTVRVTGTGGVAGAGAGGVAGAGGAKGGAPGTGGSVAGGTTGSCPAGTTPTGGKQYCSNSKGNASGNYTYELWASGNGTGCMTVYATDAKFSATWTNVEDFLARVGLGFDQTKTPAQIGTISCDFAETKTADTGLVYVGIYGWTVSPLVEYYIIDDWGSAKPADTASDGTPRTHAGTIVVDGDTYDVWTHQRVDKPAITGDKATFEQYFSVRQTARQCGHISISQHFSEWGKLGLQLGKLEEAKLLVEAQNGSGSIAFTTATVVLK